VLMNMETSTRVPGPKSEGILVRVRCTVQALLGGVGVQNLK
jgi:hypothetical protein